jgi:subtilisin family serine protease
MPYARRVTNPRRFALRTSLALFGVAASSLPGVAWADGPAQALARWLDSPRKVHPLADADGRIPVTVALEPGQSAADLGLRELVPGMAAARMTPDELAVFDELHPDVALRAGPPLRTMLDASGSWTGARAFRQSTGTDGKGAVVGIVDTGIDVTHPSFRAPDGHTRIAWLLTWGSPRGVHADVEAAMGCTDPSQAPCAVYSAADIDAILASGSVPVDLRDDVGHGTHVAGIAAGNGRNADGSKEQYVGVAPGATIVMAAPGHGGGFPDDVVVRGTKFVFDRADALGLPAVANLSLGGDYGPHDGTSPLERALESFVGDDKPGRAIVVAAGNSGALYKVGDVSPAGVRTAVHVEPHARVSIPVLLPNSTGGQVYVSIAYRKGDLVKVGLDGPDGTWIGDVPPGADAGYDDGAGTTASVINDETTKNSVLTADSSGAIVAWDGKWTQDAKFAVTLSGSGDVDLWVTATGQAGHEGAYFPHGTKAGTIAVPASAPGLMAVGCSVNRLTWTSFDGTPIEVAKELPPDSVCYYSAAGPTASGVPKPEILAPGGFVASALSVDADPRTQQDSIFDGATDCPHGAQCFVVNDNYVVSAGTSMSSPQVAGAAALLLARAPNLTQSELTDILQSAARKPTGTVNFDSQAGVGALDLTRALDVMAQEIPLDKAPAVDKSWWYVSDDTARPDPTAPVWATIELRRADGSIASGLDGKKISVLVEGGHVTKPVAKVRHGLFRFAVGAERGTGGGKLLVTVLYDGATIGETKVLDVATDPFIDTAKPTAVGGCAVGPSDASASASGGVLSALALVVAARRRLRASRT